jgi:hypothetical protein
VDLCGPNPFAPIICPGFVDRVPKTACRATDGGKCIWFQEKCPDVPPVVDHPGFCPLPVLATVTPVCSDSSCLNDSSCNADNKCCYDKNCNVRKCTPSVDINCQRYDYRLAKCANRVDIEKMYPNGVPTVWERPSDNITLPDACYRCADNAICAAVLDTVTNTHVCHWDETYGPCLEKCNNPPSPVPTPAPCAARSFCQCLTDNNCGWCQYTENFFDETLVARKVDVGVCIRKEISDKCTLSKDNGGPGGSVCVAEPDFCKLTDKPPGFENPADGISDGKIKKIISDLVSGDFTVESLQDVLTKAGVTDVIIKVILQPSSDGDKGRIKLTVVILGNKDESEYVKILNKAIADRCGVRVETVSTTIRKEDATGVKRGLNQVSPGTTYYQETTISPDTTSPSSGFSLSPIWLLALLSFLLMRI